MSRRCIVCGKKIRTGRKYCSEHRGMTGGFHPYSPESSKIRRKHKNIASDMLFLGFLFLFFAYWAFNAKWNLLGIVLTVVGFLFFVWSVKQKKSTEKTVFVEGLKRKEEKEEWKKEFYENKSKRL
jgi:Ca2+/Na+ antiporter